MNNPSDQELILQLQDGSLDALGLLYNRHQLMVYRTALGIANDPDAAADLLQDVFLRLYRFAERVDPNRPLEPWLYRVTTNLAYTYVKKRQRWFRPLEDIAEKLVGNKKQIPQYVAEMDEQSQQVHQAITSLPLQQRVVIVLYYINDLSLQEIANILDVPEGTIKSRLHYGRKALKKHLNLDGEFLPEMQYEFT
jgi:RNA polymerase sigma-70 factor (ECF subfamily)